MQNLRRKIAGLADEIPNRIPAIFFGLDSLFICVPPDNFLIYICVLLSPLCAARSMDFDPFVRADQFLLARRETVKT